MIFRVNKFRVRFYRPGRTCAACAGLVYAKMVVYAKVLVYAKAPVYAKVLVYVKVPGVCQDLGCLRSPRCMPGVWLLMQLMVPAAHN